MAHKYPMLRFLGKIPDEFYLAVSGGMDSMVLLDFFSKGSKKFTVVNFDHNTEFGAKAWSFVKDECKAKNIPFLSEKICRPIPKMQSTEDFWREERLYFFQGLDKPVITAHHLNDAMEWWLFTSLHGEAKLIPYQNNKVIRPFLITPKKEIENWAIRNGVTYLNDPANSDEKYMRAIIRHKVLPQALRVNPGLEKVIKKKYLTSK